MPRKATLLAAALLAAPAAARAQLAVRIQYPPADGRITASDSTFVFGQVTGADPADVRLTVNGAPTPVHPGGGWIAYLPVRADSTTFRAVAEAGGRTATAERTVGVPRPLWAPGPDSLPFKPETVEPTGAIEAYAGDTLRVSVVAAPGVAVTARLGGRTTRLAPESAREVNRGRQVFGVPDTTTEATPPDAAVAAAAAVGRVPPPRPWLRYAADVYVPYGGSAADSLWLDFTVPGGEPTEAPLAAVTTLDPTVTRVAVLDDDPDHAGHTNRRVVARTGPRLGYQLFLPNGTVAATGRLMGGYRQIVLGPGTSAWVPESQALPADGPRPASSIVIVRSRRVGEWTEVVLPLSERLPFGIEQRLDPVHYTVRVYGLVSNVDYMRTSVSDPLIAGIRWSEPADGVFQLDLDLAADQAWGYRARWEGTDLVLGFRHRPAALADRRFRSLLHGVRVVLDPGHNPDTGAVGPTGLEERDANLAIGLELARLLRARGAEVVMTRATADSALGLYDRTNLAVAAGGQLYVSLHNNALPDGVNPFESNGTSVLYYHPQSRPLAEAIQEELLPETGLKDHGVWYQNIAVGRMNEMPSVLVESAFMMLPDQEAALRTPAFRRRIARGIADGIERFLRERGRAGR